MKKLISLALIICMMLSLAVTVSADGVPTVYLQIEESPRVLGQVFVYVAIKDNTVVYDKDSDGQIGDAEKGGLSAYQLFVDYDQEKFTLVNILKEGKYEGVVTTNKNDAASVWASAGGLYIAETDPETYETKITGIADAKIIRYVFKVNQNVVTEEDYNQSFEFALTAKSNAALATSVKAKVDLTPVSYIMPDFRADMEGLSFEDKTVIYSGEVIDVPAVEGAPENAAVTYEIKKDGEVVSEIRNAGSYTVTANVTADGYKPATLTATVDVEKKPIIVTINDATMFYGEDIPEFTTDAPEGVQLVFNEFDDLSAGEHKIDATATSENYEVTVVSGTLTVYKPEIYAEVSQGNNAAQVFVDVFVKENIPSVDEDNDGGISGKEANGLTAYQIIMDYNKDVFKLANIVEGETYDGSITKNPEKDTAVWVNVGGLIKTETDEAYNITVTGFENAKLLRYVFTVKMDNITEADYGKQFDFAINEESNAAFEKGKISINTENISYELPKLSYTYKFCDEDGTVIAEKTAKYGSEIELPENPVKESTVQYSYSFDKWVGYTEGMKLTQDVTFTASYKEQLNKYTYKFLNEDGSVFAQETADYGTKINLPKVNPQKASTSIYTYEFDKWNGYTEDMTVAGDVEFTATFKENYIPYIEIKGETSIERGEKLIQTVSFVSPKSVDQLVCQIVCSEELTVAEIIAKDFKYAAKEEVVTKDGINYLTVVCKFEDGKTLAPNTIVSPFEVVFDVSKTTQPKEVEIKVGNDTYLKGEEAYTFEIIRNTKINILHKLAEKIEITGEDKIYEASAYVATVLPDYTSNKEVVWSVDDDTKATISQDGVLTPIKNGVVTIKAETKDGSGVYGTKTVEVFKKCSVNNIVIENGLWNKNFDPSVTEYTVYVPAETTSIKLNAEYEGGELKYNGEKVENNKVKEIEISQDEVIISLERICTDYLSRTYVIKVIRTPKETKTEVKEKEEKKEIEIVLPLEKLINREVYMVVTYTNNNGKVKVEGQLVNNDTNKFTVEVEESKEVEKCKVLFWESLANLKPVYNSSENEF